ncbi:MAG: SAM-dependent chlorinase/fluorinase [Elusimicrobiales bacterium]|nr:SAM-dependent chlorinase/fluorinase [Elusimicrobiales bacterium]
MTPPTADIVFMTDFGLADDSVAQCKAVMLHILPTARITDLTHNVEPFNIHLAAFLLAGSAPLWPKGTVFAAVVDPEVGTVRRGLALETNTGQYFVGPDNGIFTLVMRNLGVKRAIELTNKDFFRHDCAGRESCPRQEPAVSSTFHGRDIFSPVAAHIAKEPAVFSKLGPAVNKPLLADWPVPSAGNGILTGSVLHVEAPYGNIWTDIPEDIVSSSGLVPGSTITVRAAGKTLETRFARTFGDVPAGQPLAYINSRGLLGLAVNKGDFAALSGLKTGAELSVEISTEALIDMRRVSGGKLFFDIRYATAGNFTGKQVYPSAQCYLRKPAADALLRAAQYAANAPKPFRLCVLDCYRPLSVQRRFWEIMPDTRYVANPAKGSKHNRGMAVDLAACDSKNNWLELPTEFDDFSEHAHRGWAGASQAAQSNSRALEDAMSHAGFSGLPSEWWHFDYPGWETMPVLDTPFAQ